MIKTIIIIGAGLGGLTLATALKQKGFQVKIYERATHFEPIGGDIGLWPNGLQVLDTLGLYETVAQQSRSYPSIKTGHENGQLISELPIQHYHQIASYNPMNICRYELQDILVNAYGQQNIQFSKRCIRITEAAQTVTCHFDDGSSDTADLLIGADGATSYVREYVSPNCHCNYAGYISMGGINTQAYEIKYHLIYGKFHSGAFPLSNNRHMFFFNTPLENCNIYQKYPSLTDQINIFRGHSSLLDEMLENLEQSVRINNCRNYFFVKNYYLEPLENWSKNRVVLMGDAAHQIGPLLGCATAFVFEGIDVLTRSLEHCKNDYRNALATYQQIYQPRTNQLLKFERKTANEFIHGKLLQNKNFDNEFIALLKRPLLQTHSQEQITI